MSLPQFNAESSLRPPTGRYAARLVFGGSGAAGVTPTQFSGWGISTGSGTWIADPAPIANGNRYAPKMPDSVSSDV
jgi:hypothetical protein